MAGILHRRMLGMFLLSFAFAFKLHAGGSGLNTVVVVNLASSNSCELGNYFSELRHVPPENLLRISWTGTNTAWSTNDFQAVLLTPLLDMLNSRQLTNQIDYVVLSMDIPFQTGSGSAANGTTSALFYGIKSNGGTDSGVTNSYAASEAVFRQASPASAPGFSVLATMITGDSLAEAKQLVDQGVAEDGTFPLQPVVLAKSSDPARNIRYRSFDDAVFNVNILGVSSIRETNTDSLLGQSNLLGYQTGSDDYSLSPGTFVGGAIADSLTSYGGIIFGPNSQTTLLTCIRAGAAGSYGTVAEPGTDTLKFPNPQVYFYQARGFSLAECYYQSISVPHLGLMVAEPLAAPFAKRGQVGWNTNLANAVLSGIAPLSLRLIAPQGHTYQQVELFVDGKYYSTLTNLPPAPGNEMSLALNGYPFACVVPTNATVQSVAADLAAVINAPESTGSTMIQATAHGDRIELQCLATNCLASPFYARDPNSTNFPGATYQVNYLPDSHPPQMLPLRLERNGTFNLDVEVPTSMPYVLLASTNLHDWRPIFTNTAAGLLHFQDPEASNYPARFYRMAGPNPRQPPRLSAPAITASGAFQMHVDSVPGLPCAILISTNLTDWTPVLTNYSGGPAEFVDTDATNAASRFYRAWLAPDASPSFTVMNGPDGFNFVRIDSATRPFVISVSTNSTDSTAFSTNFTIGEIQTTAGSSIGSAGLLSTFLTASRPQFKVSDAFGRQGYVVPASALSTGAWLQFSFTLTNGTYEVVGVTNQVPAATSAELVGQLCTLINSKPALQNGDGVVAEDFAVDPVGTATFNLRARSRGLLAAAIRVHPKKSGNGLYILPSAPGTLTQNQSDLQARNHLYVTAGANNLNLAFTLDTTNLTDGYHELTAVAYEGSHVRTQTRASIPVRVQNTALSATLTLLNPTSPALVSASYDFEVAANTGNVSAITLFSTGGALATVTGQATNIFNVQGTNLWAGLHPFYALVETASGLKYRTQTHWVRLVNGP